MHPAIASFGALIAISLSTAAWSTEPRDPQQFFFQDTFADMTEEMALVEDEGKQALLIMFEMDECPFCHRMKTTILNQPDVQDYYREHFRIIAIDIEGDVELTNFQGEVTTMKDFAFKENKVRATPVFAFFDTQGQRIARYTGATSSPEEFLWLGEFVADGHYVDQRFTQYKRDKRQQARAQ